MDIFGVPDYYALYMLRDDDLYDQEDLVKLYIALGHQVVEEGKAIQET